MLNTKFNKNPFIKSSDFKCK